jgi:hypothetical protein
MACLNGHLSVVERLLADPRVDPSVYNNAAIRNACLSGLLSVVERLLADPRVDPSAYDNYAMRWASENGRLSVVERLLADPRVDPVADDNAAIREASENVHLSSSGSSRMAVSTRTRPTTWRSSPCESEGRRLGGARAPFGPARRLRRGRDPGAGSVITTT